MLHSRRLLRKVKKAIGVTVASSSLVACLSQISRAQEFTAEVGEVMCSLDTKTGVLKISGKEKPYSNCPDNFVRKFLYCFVPLTVNEKTTRALGRKEQNEREYIKSKIRHVRIDHGILNIGMAAFEDCKNLISVEMPDSLEAIGCKAFKGCENLISVKIPNSVTQIQCYAFYGCALLNLEIPDSVAHIYDYAFGKCMSLFSVKILGHSNHKIELHDKVFAECSSLSLIEADHPENCNLIEGVFKDCANLISYAVQRRFRI